MKRTCLTLLVLGSLFCTRAAQATPTEQAHACVAASTAGQTERDEGHLLAARGQLLSCTREVCPDIVRHSCADWLSELELRIPSVVVRVYESGAGDLTDATIAIDGAASALDGRAVMLDPGKHILTVEAPGFTRVEQTFLVAEREKARLLSVQLPARARLHDEQVGSAPTVTSAAEPTVNRRDAQWTVPVGAWVLGGVGVAGLVSFAILGSQARNDLHELLHDCSPSCSDRQRDAGKHKALAADLSLGLGLGALVAASAWTLVSLRRTKRSHPASVSLLPTRGGAFGAWSAQF